MLTIPQRVNVFTLFVYLAQAVVQGSVFSAYLFLIANQTATRVGMIAGTDGVVRICMAPTVGCLSDRFLTRAQMLKIGGVIGLFAVFFSAKAFSTDSFPALLVAQVIWGAFWSVTTPTIDSLLADSCPAGTRSRVYTARMSIMMVSSAMGPAIALIMFAHFGDKWTIHHCRSVVYVGLCMYTIPISMLLLAFTDPPPPPPSLPLSTASSASSTSAEATGDLQLPIAKYLCPASVCGSFNVLYVPSLIGISDVITGLASGMTIKMFPLFFIQLVGLNPVGLQAVYLVTPLCISLALNASSALSLRIGRLQTCLSMRSIGISFLLLLIVLATGPQHAPTGLVILVYVVRTAFMNANKPITKSIIMDTVPKEQRARWNALETINGATFSGSALVGGLLIDIVGFRGTFMCTALLQTLSLVPLAVLLAGGHVPPERTVEEQSSIMSAKQQPEMGAKGGGSVELAPLALDGRVWAALPTESTHGDLTDSRFSIDDDGGEEEEKEAPSS